MQNRVVTAGIVVGIGLGGFADGIVLHQIAQWHNMGSGIVPPHTMEAMRQNMVWDGLFHLAAWAITLIGVFMLWGQARVGSRRPSARQFVGQLMFGWGGLNLAEGVINHHLLGLHHVRDLPVHRPAYDWMFLGIGAVGFLLIGWLLMRPDGESGHTLDGAEGKP